MQGCARKCLIHCMCVFDSFCFCPHIHRWLLFEVEMRLMVLSLDVRHTGSCDTVCQLLQWVDAFTDVLFKEPCCSQNARVSQHNCVNVCLCVLTLMCVYILGSFKDPSPSGKCVLSYWDNLWDSATLEQNTIFLKVLFHQNGLRFEARAHSWPVLSQANWSLSQIGCMFPQAGQTNSDLMLQRVVYLTITSVKTNIACPGVCKDSMALLFCILGVILVYWHLS